MIPVEPLHEVEAIRMAWAYARRRKLNLTVEQLMSLHSSTKGHPLAIRLAIGQAVTGKIEFNDLLTGLPNPAGGLKKMYDYLYKGSLGLGEEKGADRVFMALSLFETGARRDALEYVCGLGEKFRDVLAEALRLALIESRGNEIYILQEIARHQAKELIDKDPQAGDYRRRFAEWYRDFTRSRASELEPEGFGLSVSFEVTKGRTSGKYRAALNDLEMEYRNCLVAVESALETGEWEIVCKLSESLARFFYIRFYLPEWEQLSRWALEASRSLNDRHGEAYQLENLGLIYRNQGKLDEALKYHKASFEIYKEIGYRKGEATNLGNIGLIYKIQGRLDEALRCFQSSLKIHKEIGFRLGEGSQLGYIGLIYDDRGELDEAMKYYQDSLKIHREIGYRQGEAYQLANIGVIYMEQGKLDKALENYKDSLKICTEIGDRKAEASILGSPGEY
jgi:tetratricopeptide (TPR) repeat protein